MTIDVYPAHMTGNNIDHADNWDDESTMNMANGNFYNYFSELLGDQNVPASPGMWKTKFIANAMRMNTKPLSVRYTTQLARIVARAEILKAEYIAYA